MANNYTITSSTTSELVGDTVANGSISSPVTLIVTPDTGYVIQASDFYIGSTLPTEVTQVVFADTGTALDPANTVTATVTLANWYTMPTNPDTISIDIDAKIVRPLARYLNFTSIEQNADNLTSVSTALNTGTLTTVVGGTSTTSTVVHSLTVGLLAEVAKVVFTADSGYFLPSTPSFSIVSSNLARWSSTTTNQVYNSSNKLTSITFTFYYNMGNQDIYASAGESIIWSIPELEADPVARTSIFSAYFSGSPNNSILPSGDVTLQLFVSGSEYSTYNIKVEDRFEKTYDFSSNDGTFSRSLSTSGEQTIYSPVEQMYRDREVGKNQHLITIPYLVRKEDSSTNYYKTTITPTGSTTTGASGTSTAPFIITLNQFGLVDVSLGLTASTYGVNTSTGTIKNLLNQNPLSYPTTFNPTDFPAFSDDNNGFFSITHDLGYTVTDTVDDASGFSSTTMTMDTSYVTKKVEIGDTVVDSTNGYFAAGTTITAVNVGGDVKVYTLSHSPTSTVTDGSTITFTRTVGISRQPVASDFVASASVVGVTWLSLTCVVIQAVSNSATIQVDDTTDLSVGHAVQGNGIVGYPTIVVFSSNSITLSTSQTIDVGTTLKFTPAMSELNVSEMSVTGAGTTSCKLNLEGYIQRVGNTDVTGSLILNNFITTYAAPTAAAVTATCIHGESISISPIPDCTGHTETLYISEVSDATQLKITGGEQSMIFTAPSSGTSSSLTYNINDGVQRSTSAAITITLTSS